MRISSALGAAGFLRSRWLGGDRGVDPAWDRNDAAGGVHAAVGDGLQARTCSAKPRLIDSIELPTGGRAGPG